MTKKQTTPFSKRKKRDAPDPAWTYHPPPLSEKGEAFLHDWLAEHPPTPEEGLTGIVYEPVIRRILHLQETATSPLTSEGIARITGYTTHIASYVDRLLYHAGTHAERERVFIELVEAQTLLAFVPGGLPRLPQICDAVSAEVLAAALAAFLSKEEERQDGEEHGASECLVNPSEDDLSQTARREERQRCPQVF